jgi:predicted DNA-binding transcriptional regulator AlpA
MQTISFEQLPQAVAELGSQLVEIRSLLQNMATATPSTPASDQWLNVKELSEYLPSRPAVATIYEYTANETIPFSKQGKKLVFLKSDIDEWLRSGRKKTKAEQMDELRIDAEKQLEAMRNKTKK